ncbi:MAG TPA: Spy/CpxP family protein refolding chaperone [Methylomirabilota bacterium]|nr:Spy/CpxP family protein refolding chaperone [Methylomirabilota bacterium]
MRATNAFRAAALTLVATLFTATALYAANAQTGPGQPSRWEDRLQQKLGLTDDQLQAFRQLNAARDVEAQRQQHRSLRAAQTELRRLALNGADDATLAAKQAEIQTLLAQQMQQRVSALKQIGPILNPDQRELFAKMMERGPHGRHHNRAPHQRS